MQTVPSSPAPSTRERILEAAARVFAQQGLEGATTREIAQRAKVNEVTLFRHFRCKERLLEAVLQRTFAEQENTARERTPAGPTEAGEVTPVLRTRLLDFAQRYEDLLQRNILLLRTLLGEIHRHREHETRVLRGIFAPLKAELLASIQAGREHGQVRNEIEPVVAADLFASMIFVDVLRRSSHFGPEYQQTFYLESAVDIFARGIEP